MNIVNYFIIIDLKFMNIIDFDEIFFYPKTFLKYFIFYIVMIFQ